MRAFCVHVWQQTSYCVNTTAEAESFEQIVGCTGQTAGSLSFEWQEVSRDSNCRVKLLKYTREEIDVTQTSIQVRRRMEVMKNRRAEEEWLCGQ